MTTQVRNRRKISLSERYYWVNELTIGDIFNLYYIVDDITNESDFKQLFSKLIQEDSLVGFITNCPFQVLFQINPSELKIIYDVFLDINKQLFNKSIKQTTAPQTFDSFIFALFDLQCRLIEAGHLNAMDYGYSYFVRAINNYEQSRSRNIAEYAVASRNAYHADNKEWKKYIKELIRRG